MSNDFADFADAVMQRGPQKQARTAPDLARVAVLGGGDDARLIAALCLSDGRAVTLFSAYGAELEAMRASSGIALRGAGPVGTYHVDRASGPSVRLTAELDAAVRGADLIFLTGPIHKQRTYAMVLADHLSDGQVLVLAPGRSLGALETAWYLRIGGATADVTLVEIQGLPFWFAADGAVLTLSEAETPVAATLPSGRTHILEVLQPLIPCQALPNVVASGFADGSALVELPALLMSGPALGSGAVPIPMGGVPLPENQTFRALIGPEQERLIAAAAAERRAVAHAFGVRDGPTDAAWLETHAGATKGPGARPVPDAARAQILLRDGVIGSLVPLASAAALSGVPVPVTEALITLASTVLGADVAAAGRRLETIGITATEAAAARAQMDALVGVPDGR